MSIRYLKAVGIPVIAVLIAGCGTAASSQSGSAGRGAKTRPTAATLNPVQRRHAHIVTSDLGLAFGTFHRYVSLPLKAEGARRHRAHRAVALRRAGAASAAVLRETARAKALATDSAEVRQLFAPLAALQASLGSLSHKLREGRPDAADLVSATGAIAAIERTVSASGSRIIESFPPSAP